MWCEYVFIETLHIIIKQSTVSIMTKSICSTPTRHVASCAAYEFSSAAPSLLLFAACQTLSESGGSSAHSQPEPLTIFKIHKYKQIIQTCHYSKIQVQHYIQWSYKWRTLSLGTSFPWQFLSKFSSPVCNIPQLTAANFLHIAINFLRPLEPNICRCELRNLANWPTEFRKIIHGKLVNGT